MKSSKGKKSVIKKIPTHMTYKNYEITETHNEWGYYEAISLIDCDALVIFAETIEQIKIEIDELDL